MKPYPTNPEADLPARIERLRARRLNKGQALLLGSAARDLEAGSTYLAAETVRILELAVFGTSQLNTHALAGAESAA